MMTYVQRPPDLWVPSRTLRPAHLRLLKKKIFSGAKIKISKIDTAAKFCKCVSRSRCASFYTDAVGSRGKVGLSNMFVYPERIEPFRPVAAWHEHGGVWKCVWKSESVLSYFFPSEVPEKACWWAIWFETHLCVEFSNIDFLFEMPWILSCDEVHQEEFFHNVYDIRRLDDKREM